MKKKLLVFMMSLAILSGVIVSFKEQVNYIVEEDGEIEWHTHNKEIIL